MSKKCRASVKKDYEELFAKKEAAIDGLSDDLKKKFANENINPDSFKPAKIDEIADEINILRDRIKDPKQFQAEARKLIATMQSERINKKIDMYEMQLKNMELEADIIGNYSPKEVLKNMKELFDVRIEERSNHLTSKNMSVLHQLYSPQEKDILSTNNPNVIRRIINSVEGNTKGASEIEITIAKKWKKYNDYLHQQQVDAGFRLGYIHNYTGRRSYDPKKLRLKRDAAVEQLAKSIDIKATFPHLDLRNPRDAADFKNIIEKIIDGRIDSDINASSINVGKLDQSLRSSLEARQTRERKLKFLPGAEAEWHLNFGKETILDQMLSQSRTVANVSANREIMGVNPRAASKSLVEKLKRKLNDTENPGFAHEKVERAVFAEDYLDKMWAPHDGTLTKLGGDTYHVKADSVATMANNIKSLIYMSKLGKTMISALVDLPNAAAMLDASTGQGLMQSYTDIALQVFKDAPGALKAYLSGNVSKEMQIRAAEVGVFFEAGISNMMKRSGIEGTGTKWVNKMMEFSERINPLGKQTSFHDYSALMAYQNAFAKMLKKSELSEEMVISMKRAGMSTEYASLLRGAIGDIKGTTSSATVFSPGKIAKMGVVQLMEFKAKIGKNNPKVASQTLDQFRNETMSKVQVLFDDFRNNAIPKPGAATKRWVAAGQKGTVKGELLNSLTMLKSFSVKMLEVQERIYGSTSDKGKAMARSGSFAVSLTGFGVISLTLSDITKNATPRDMSSSETWKEAMVKGGALGIFGDLASIPLSENPQQQVGSLIGPAFGVAKDAATVLGKGINSLSPDRRTRKKGLSMKDSKIALRNLPFQNNLVFRPLVDYLFLDSMMKSADPRGYRNRMRNMRKRGQKSIYNKSLLYK